MTVLIPSYRSMLRNIGTFVTSVEGKQVLIPSYRSMLRNEKKGDAWEGTVDRLNPFLQVNA